MSQTSFESKISTSTPAWANLPRSSTVALPSGVPSASTNRLFGIEAQYRGQMEQRLAAGCIDRTRADFVAAQSRNFLRRRDMG